MGITFDSLEENAAIQKVVEFSGRPDFTYVVTPNVDHIVRLDKGSDAAVLLAYRHADLTLCDSRVLARLARMSSIDMPVVPGSDLTRDLLNSVLGRKKIAVIGGDRAVHDNLATRFVRFDWSFHEPPMGVRHDAGARMKIAEFVENARADIILFAIGAPQSELICAEIKRRGAARGVALCVGASLEFVTGAKQRAPRWMQKSGLEWLFRLLSEPRRLWKRYLVEGPQIFVVWQRWRRLNRLRPRGASGSTPSDDE